MAPRSFAWPGCDPDAAFRRKTSSPEGPRRIRCGRRAAGHLHRARPGCDAAAGYSGVRLHPEAHRKSAQREPRSARWRRLHRRRPVHAQQAAPLTDDSGYARTGFGKTWSRPRVALAGPRGSPHRLCPSGTRVQSRLIGIALLAAANRSPTALDIYVRDRYFVISRGFLITPIVVAVILPLLAATIRRFRVSRHQQR